MGSPVAQGSACWPGAVQPSQGFAGCGLEVCWPSIYGASLRVSRPHAQVLLPVLKGEGGASVLCLHPVGVLLSYRALRL